MAGRGYAQGIPALLYIYMTRVGTIKQAIELIIIIIIIITRQVCLGHNPSEPFSIH